MTSLSFVGIMPAAGIGSRMQLELPKQYLQFGGRSMIEYSLLALLAETRIEKVIVALHPEDKRFQQLAISLDPRIYTVTGGVSRSKSVLNALCSLSSSDQVMAVVHDAARPCLSAGDLKLLLDQAQQDPKQGAILATPVRDTMKRAKGGYVLRTEARNDLWHALTPQVFMASELATQIMAANSAGVDITDEASAMEWAGFRPALVKGSSNNIKVTQADDLALAACLLQQNGHQENQ
ncbi:2-C-methyl-D-erythritol 4-phosphate cytidylyltransferase [Aliidiomarina minuta]|uniref:2-C-methyl-D-erythritol 4-phosphate cytidylyltransferase n=1 Tax=Aliidiomarina minuta TaxID=880057 RepID=A0A432W6V5_9GAMM|nr:2-C-methyl-D-erythritol 4-phosphate cytidylyltransferase [Aliidiomarina minuta]RUO25813.1 2-C-methyl-D-erythritol 4-phosphate cytidylyltransferase [Aliidiomarina minuta]